ncbi:MAG: chromosomal replication initiator protein DnaA [Sedimentisphaerales bacterium]|nr:chromosomal replication initiator protein DnaA [Sedimentisphaerales bacterium]
MQGTITDEAARIAGSQVNAINEALAETIGMQKYRIWFKNSTRLSLTNGYLKVGVPNLFIAGWIENHFLNELSKAVRQVTGADIKINIAIDPELAGQQRRTQLDSQAQLVEKARNRTRYQRNPRGKTQTASGKKLKLSIDTFVVGPSNELAYNAAKVIIDEERSPFNPLFIHGGYGVGKTHLIQGICNAIAEKRPLTNWMYLSAEEFANQFILALKLKKLESFRNRIRKIDILAIDDIHFFASKPSTQEEFLHTFNTISLAGKQVILASDAHPKMIGQLSEKLVNRFVSGMVVKIETPDFNTRCEICRRCAETMTAKAFGRRTLKNDMATNISESVIKYIAENLRTNVRELEGALLKLIAFAALQNQKINLTMAKAVLAEHLARTDPIVHISDIESAVATYFGITPANIHSSKKGRTVAMARHFSMYLTRKHTKMSSSEIGRFMGNKNHATVLLACKKIEDLLARNAELKWQGPTGNKIAKAKEVLTQLEAGI